MLTLHTGTQNVFLLESSDTLWISVSALSSNLLQPNVMDFGSGFMSKFPMHIIVEYQPDKIHVTH
jgi:hypothetical protein